MGSIENEEHVIFKCNKYNNIRADTFGNIKTVDQIDLNGSDGKENLQLLFIKGSLKSLNIFGQFVNKVFEIRDKVENEIISYTIFL